MGDERMSFDTSLRDSQGVRLAPIAPERFDCAAYRDYEEGLQARGKAFFESDGGLLVYRRMRADGVFYDACKDMKLSLSLQLGGLQAGMRYAADVANFLEPWYGIGYIAAAFGAQYTWLQGQAPAVEPMFHSIEELLAADAVPLAQTDIGKHILEMTEYFLDKTHGMVPMSLCDVQAPVNMLSYLLPVTDLFLELVDDPEAVAQAAHKVAQLAGEFLQRQRALIGGALALPGHGFASSRAFCGLAMSADNAVMLAPDDYAAVFKPSDEAFGAPFGGVAFHSCGTWARQLPMVKTIAGLRQVDGAFSSQTDPAPNDPAPFADALAGSGIVLNARAVGALQEVLPVFERLSTPKQKLIAVTYCETPEQQQILYDALHGFACADAPKR